MKYIFKFCNLPDDKSKLKIINEAADRLYYKLEKLDVKALNISDYNKKYFASRLKELKSNLQKYAYILLWATAGINIPPSKFVFLDYGGGCGVLSLLAKECGIGTVIYNDIYDVSARDAETIAKAIGNQADYYVPGDIDEVIDFLKERSISCNAIANYDVIEHIYDIEEFLRKISLISDHNLRVFLSSGANPHNPLIRRKLAKNHLKCEFLDREEVFGRKERDPLISYYKIRKEIIKSLNPDLSEDQISYLSSVTRGLIKSDIKKAVDEYLGRGTVTLQQKYPQYPTNTCDPYTGNWAEHLMDINQLRNVLQNQDFQAYVLCGYYGDSNILVKRLATQVLNLWIKKSGKYGLMFSPFFTLYANRFSSADNSKN
jgi:2-polyprenyl-3-methyl-5-hydroxy-6-metoxy-1,4-benzoquinol methylase